MRRLLISQSASLKTNCAYHETVSSNRSPQRGLAVCSQCGKTAGPRWSYQRHLLPQLGSITGGIIFKSRGQGTQSKEEPEMRADGAGGLISRFLHLGSWSRAITSCFLCWWSPALILAVTHHLQSCFRWLGISLSSHNLLTLPPSITCTPNHIIECPLNLCVTIYELFQTYFRSYPSFHYYSENRRLS